MQRNRQFLHGGQNRTFRSRYGIAERKGFLPYIICRMQSGMRDAFAIGFCQHAAADISAGYSYLGNCIQKQKQELDEFKAEFETQLMSFADMEDGKRNRWCYYDLLRRGAITR